MMLKNLSLLFMTNVAKHSITHVCSDHLLVISLNITLKVWH